jgi:hypothetical protein
VIVVVGESTIIDAPAGPVYSYYPNRMIRGEQNSRPFTEAYSVSLLKKLILCRILTQSWE